MVSLPSAELNGERLRAVRKQKGKSVPELAKDLGVHPQSLRNYEAGSRSLDIENLQAMHVAGLDTLFVLFGKPTDLFVAEHVDWKALVDIVDETERLCSLNDGPVTNAMRAEILRLAYGRLAESRSPLAAVEISPERVQRRAENE